MLLTVASDGSGKLSSSFDFPTKGRGGYGVKAMRDGGIIAFMAVKTDDQIMLATNSGQSIRCKVSDISFRSRTAGGVRVLRMAKGDEVAAVARIAESEEPGDDSAREPE